MASVGTRDQVRSVHRYEYDDAYAKREHEYATKVWASIDRRYPIGMRRQVRFRERDALHLYRMGSSRSARVWARRLAPLSDAGDVADSVVCRRRDPGLRRRAGC